MIMRVPINSIMIIFIAMIAAAMVAGTVSLAYAQNGKAGTVDSCLAIADNTARLRCFENALSNQLPRPKLGSASLPGGWQLVRTPNPQGGNEAVSIMHTPDLSRSDRDLAGLMIRCAEQNAEVVIVLLRSLKPRSRPQVRVGAGGSEVLVEATVIPPFAAILLPDKVAAQMVGPWQSLAEISVEVNEIAAGSEQSAPIRGVIPLSGLQSAYQSLMASCPAR